MLTKNNGTERINGTPAIAGANPLVHDVERPSGTNEQNTNVKAATKRNANAVAISHAKSAYISKRDVTRAEAAAYTKRIRLGNEARDLMKLINDSGEAAVRENTAVDSACDCARVQLLNRASGDKLVMLLQAMEEDGKNARDELVERYRRLAAWVVEDLLKAPMTPTQRKDAIGEAEILLFEIVSEGKYDRTKSTFPHYYVMRALPKLYKFINEDKLIKASNDDVRVTLKLNSACTKFYQDNLRKANNDERASMLSDIMEELGIKPRKGGYTTSDVVFYESIGNVSFFSEPIGKDETELGDLIAAPMRLEDEAAYREALEEICDMADSCLSVLSERDRTIVRERCLSEEYRDTLEEIAAKNNITKARVGQIFGGNPENSAALKKMAKKCDLDAIRARLSKLRLCETMVY